ncbi:MAG: hypothetical protein CL946_12095 [Ectothiorhodospiraceae bacterium]|nr:hypothetical protein [Ectothiorhodospiraceae bacterium]
MTMYKESALKKYSTLSLVLLHGALVFVACSDDDDDGVTNSQRPTVAIWLTDVPTTYDEVNITFNEISAYQSV